MLAYSDIEKEIQLKLITGDVDKLRSYSIIIKDNLDLLKLLYDKKKIKKYNYNAIHEWSDKQRNEDLYGINESGVWFTFTEYRNTFLLYICEEKDMPSVLEAIDNDL